MQQLLWVTSLSHEHYQTIVDHLQAAGRRDGVRVETAPQALRNGNLERAALALGPLTPHLVLAAPRGPAAAAQWAKQVLQPVGLAGMIFCTQPLGQVETIGHAYDDGRSEQDVSSDENQ